MDYHSDGSHKNHSNFIKLFQLLLTYFREAYSPRYAYQICDWEKGDDPEKDYIKVQIVDTRHVLKLTPAQIVSDDKLLSGFSPLDVRTIMVLSMPIFNKPKYKVVINDFRSKLGKQILTIKQEGKPELIRQSVEELSQNLDMIKEFDPVDAFNIGRIRGENDMYFIQKDLTSRSH